VVISAPLCLLHAENVGISYALLFGKSSLKALLPTMDVRW